VEKELNGGNAQHPEDYQHVRDVLARNDNLEVSNTPLSTRTTLRRPGQGTNKWRSEFLTKNPLKRGSREGGVVVEEQPEKGQGG